MDVGFVLMANQYKTYDALASANRTLRTIIIDHNVRMEQKDRLAQAMREAGYDNPTEAWRANSRALEISKDLLISNRNGNRPISKKTAERYAAVFGHTAGWYLYGEADEPAGSGSIDIPLVSMVSAGRMRDQSGVSPSDVERYVKMDGLPPGNWIALTVDGQSMNRIAPEGSVLIVNRNDNTLLDGKFYIFALDGGQATFKTYRRNPARLQPFSYDPDFMSTPVGEENDLYVFGRVRRIIQDV